MAAGSAVHQTRFSSRRRRLQRRVLLFSVLCAVVGLLLGGTVFCVMEVYLPLKKLRETNAKTFERIHCDVQACDISGIANDWVFTASDYVLDKDTYLFLNLDQPAAEFSGFALHYSDPNFFKRFETPASVLTPAGESWRLYSAQRQVGDKRVGIVVGYAERVSWKMDFPTPPSSLIDQQAEGAGRQDQRGAPKQRRAR